MEDKFRLPKVSSTLQDSQVLSDSPYPRLRLVLQPGGQIFSVQTSEVVLGRHEECDILLPYADVSRRHCRIQQDQDRWFMSDLSSTNGVYVNDIKVAKVELKDGDRLRIGSYNFLVDLSGKTLKQQNRPGYAQSVFKSRLKASRIGAVIKKQ